MEAANIKIRGTFLPSNQHVPLSVKAPTQTHCTLSITFKDTMCAFTAMGTAVCNLLINDISLMQGAGQAMHSNDGWN